MDGASTAGVRKSGVSTAPPVGVIEAVGEGPGVGGLGVKVGCRVGVTVIGSWVSVAIIALEGAQAEKRNPASKTRVMILKSFKRFTKSQLLPEEEPSSGQSGNLSSNIAGGLSTKSIVSSSGCARAKYYLH